MYGVGCSDITRIYAPVIAADFPVTYILQELRGPNILISEIVSKKANKEFVR